MLNDITKRKINSLRQILVGKVPDPKSQVEQITNALIYKYMDDMDRQAEVFGGKPSFFVKEYEKYAWRNLMSPKLGGQERMNLYMEALEKMGTNKNLSPIFRDILKNSYVPYRSPETLNLFLSEIDGFAYDHSEDLGDAFEYLLSIMGAQGDAGQFRTPRHIIDFIVEVVDPKKDQKILDPACGTAGFLISAYKHILKQNQKENPGDTLTHDERANLHKNFIGYDISPEMAKLSRVNMFLHNFPDPKIYEYDTLSSEERWRDNFDVIIANPPFMSPKGGIIPHKKFRIQAKKAEALFVDYIVEHLKPKGRAGIIVPEGIIFANTYKELRKMLVEDGLFAVVSLPVGVFNPYSAVKTSVLLFDNSLAKQSKEILFVKIENDGYDLGAQRRPINKNDLPEALRILNEWKGGKKTESKLAVWVEKSKIAESDDYNLSGDRYRIATDYTNAKWPMVELGEACEINPKKSEISSLPSDLEVSFVPMSDISEDEIFFVPKQTKKLLEVSGSYTYFKNNDVLLAKVTPCFENGKAGIARNLKNDIGFGSSELIVFRPSEKILSEFVYYCVTREEFREKGKQQMTGTGGLQRLPTGFITKYKIPLPPLEIQKQIVAELDRYQNIITGAKQITKNWKPKIEIDPTWTKVKLENILEKVGEQIDPKNKKGEVFYVGLENIESCSGVIVGNPVTKYEEIKSLKNTFQPNNLLYGKLRPNLNKVWLANQEGICSTDILVFRVKQNSVANFYWYLLLSDDFVSEVMAGIKGAQLPRVGFEHLKNLILPLPPLSTQKQIVEKIEAERALVDSTQKLIEIYEQKTKETLSKLWNT